MEAFDASPAYSPLQEDIAADVVIVGGGISGVTASYLLTQEGLRVALLEKARLGSGETSATTAFITESIDTSLQDLFHTLGPERAAQVWHSGEAAIKQIAEIVSQERIVCEFRRVSAHIFASRPDQQVMIIGEAELAQKLGFAASFHEHGNLGFTHYGYVALRHQAAFHPGMYIAALAHKATLQGARIYEETRVTELERQGDDSVTAKTAYGSVRARWVLVLTHTPFYGPPEIQARLVPYTTYVIAARIPKGVVPEHLYWDAESPYHYLRVDAKENYDRIIVGGEDHRTGTQTAITNHHARLEEYLQRILPGVPLELTHKWGGQVIETGDGLPFIGIRAMHPNEIIGTGYAGNGMTFGTLAAMMARDIVLGRKNEWTDLYNPARLSGVATAVKEAAHYTKELVTGRMNRPPAALDAIAPDSGAVLTIGDESVAAYKDPGGNVTQLSPVCTHLGCIVSWNDTGKTWDCPCHGSRFDKKGAVITGPATEPLERMN